MKTEVWTLCPFLELSLGREIWRGKLKNVEKKEMSTVGRGIWQEN